MPLPAQLGRHVGGTVRLTPALASSPAPAAALLRLCRAGRKLRTDATVEEVYALGALLGQGGGWPYAAKLSCPFGCQLRDRWAAHPCTAACASCPAAYSKVRLATDLLLGQQWACKIMRLPRGDKLVEDPMAGRAAIMKVSAAQPAVKRTRRTITAGPRVLPLPLATSPYGRASGLAGPPSGFPVLAAGG